MSDGFPPVTTKKLHLRSIIHELLLFLSGDTYIKYLKDNGVSIWDEWADENGDLGPVYGHQWRHFPKLELIPGTTGDEAIYRAGSIDQFADLVEMIENLPTVAA